MALSVAIRLRPAVTHLRCVSICSSPPSHFFVVVSGTFDLASLRARKPERHPQTLSLLPHLKYFNSELEAWHVLEWNSVAETTTDAAQVVKRKERTEDE
jgi:hypothetical protein